jgi:4-diphosphocytidyl-2-C-methyl-D-erythritol kinase
MEEVAYAKLNLALHVRGREPDGYHRIETVFAFVEDGDLLRVEPGRGLSLRITGPFAAGLPEGEDNLVMRAARSLPGAREAALTLDKRLPVASGIGGGSADAAAALRLLDRWWDLGLGEARLLEFARPLGADVPACLLSRTTGGEGRGDRLTPLNLGLAGTPVLLVNPGVPLSTAEVFRLWDGTSGAENDLLAPARRLAPVIDEVLAALAGAPRSGMSGSGATCFGLYGDETARDRAAAALPEGWWRLASRLR